jgi:hypothetical protein
MDLGFKIEDCHHRNVVAFYLCGFENLSLLTGSNFLKGLIVRHLEHFGWAQHLLRRGIYILTHINLIRYKHSSSISTQLRMTKPQA